MHNDDTTGGETTQTRVAAVAQAGTEPTAKVQARMKAEATTKAKAEAEVETKAKAKAKAEAEAKPKANAKAEAEAEGKPKAEAEAKARAEAQVKAKGEARATPKAEAKATTEAKAHAEYEEKVEALAQEKAKTEVQAKATAEAEAKAKAEVEQKTKFEAEVEAKTEAAAEAEVNAKAAAEDYCSEGFDGDSCMGSPAEIYLARTDGGFDLAAGKVEVVPTAHYFMGGVVVDVDTRTAMEGLYVAGEDAGGAHGSNRLGGNGVANSTVYGGIAGDTMGRDVAGMSLRDPDEDVLAAEFERAIYPLSHKPDLVLPLRKQLQNTMWEDVGVMRTEAGMKRGLKGIVSVSEALMDVGVEASNLAFNLTWHDWLNLRSLCDISEVIAKAGIARENSRGAHFREDFPEPGAMEDSAFTVATLKNGQVDVTNEPVQFTIVRPGETVLPEGAPETLVAAQ